MKIRRMFKSDVSTIFFIAYKNILSKKLRSFLTIFGVVIGIGAISFLVSFGLGIQQLVEKEVIGNQSLKAIDVRSSKSDIISLDDEVKNKIVTFAHVEDVGVSYSFPVSLSLDEGQSDGLIVYGVDKPYQDLASLTLTSGRLLEESDNRAVVISETALKSIGYENPQEVVGQTVELNIPIEIKGEDDLQISDEFEVIGIIDTGSDSELFIPASVIESAGVSQYDQFKVIVDSTDSVTELRAQIEALGLETISPVDTLNQIDQLFTFFNFILAGFGAVGMIVAVLGMFNTLTISLIERTKEIGLMMTLGARRKEMRLLFLIEALLLSISGAIIGILGSVSFGWIINMVVNRTESASFSDNINLFSTPGFLIVGLVAFMSVVGLGVVYFPARRAEKINPIDALRRE